LQIALESSGMPRSIAQPSQDLPEYDALLAAIQALLEQRRSEAFQRIDQIRVRTYVEIGRRIIAAELRHRERADYGRQVIAALARDIGFSDSNLYNMIAVARVFDDPDALPERLSWSHLVKLSYVDEPAARQFYLDQARRHQWSVRYLEQQIDAGLYARSTGGGQLAPAPAAGLPVRAQDVLRSEYTFDIPGLPAGKHSERDLEAGLRANFELFLKELGPDFYIRDTQRQIVVDGQYHTVDLELYHRGVPAIVIVELKVGAMKARDVGQVNSYVNWYAEHVARYDWEQLPIGLLICQSAGAEEVRYALGGLEQRIFVARYQVRLPGEDVIAGFLRGRRGR
jgi:predicted nuclease of restriction endonuclease-like (RecB) superfamily